jgi:anti-sigma B factor antagonist
MDIATEQIGDVTVIVVPGSELDASNYVEFKKTVTGILEANGKVILDVSQLRFADSSGLGAILFCFKKLSEAGGVLKLCGLSERVRMAFELIRFHRIMDVYNSRAEALAAFQSTI